MAGESATSQLTTQKNERIKSYIVFDGVGRIWKVYTAPVGAIHGTECGLDEYVYKDGASTEVKGRKEGVGTWDSSYDAIFTI